MLFNISCKMATVRVFCAGFVLCQVAITFAIYLYVFMGSNDGQHIYGSTSIVASGLSTGVSGAITGKVRRNHTIGAPLIDFIVQEADTPHHGNVSNNIDLFKGTLQEDPWGYVSVERNKTLDFHCNACAVITASGHLLGKAAGAEIDSFQCVIRMNDHPTEKFSADVGKKTTARIISHASIKNQIRAQSNNLFQGVSKPNFNIFWGKGPALHIDIIRKLQSTYPLVKMYVTNVTQYEFGENVFRRETGLDRFETKTWLSTGWYTMIFALRACDSVTVYGLSDYEYCKRHRNDPDIPYHYFDPTLYSECGLFNKSESHPKESHRFLTEKYIFSRWRDTHNLSFRYPSWDDV